MKTIAISIDEELLRQVDQMTSSDDYSFSSRSALLREAAEEFIRKVEREREEGREREIFRRNRASLKKQARALISGQAQP